MEANPTTANVVIVGAGPAGTATAVHLGQLGVKDVVIVDRHDFPRDKTCGSAISPRGITVCKQLGVWSAIEERALWIKGMRLVTPGGQDAYLSAGDKFDAVVCARRILDHEILKRALDLGVQFIPHFTASRLLEEHGRVVGCEDRSGRTIRAQHVVIAGGTHCLLTTKPRPKPTQTIQAIMGWWEHVPHRPNFIEMIYDKNIVPYYGWLFPETETRVNIGITYEDVGHTKRAREIFSQFLETYYRPRLSGATQIGKWKGHPVAYDYKVEQLTSPGRIVVGEAGRMTHPATAEGIYHGIRSGMLAAEAIRDVLEGRHDEVNAHQQYEAACRKAFIPSFYAAWAFRKLVSTPAFEWLVATARHRTFQSLTGKLLASL